MSEKHEQIALFQRAALHPICSRYMFHIPNGGHRNVAEAASLKRQGVKPGVPDIFLAYPSGPWHGLFIELKSKKGKLSKHQATMLGALANVLYGTWVCYGWEHAWKIIEEYLA